MELLKKVQDDIIKKKLILNNYDLEKVDEENILAIKK